MTPVRKRAIQGAKAGDTFTAVRTFTQEQMKDFSKISRDYNPVHFSGDFAGAKGFSGTILHGLLVAAMITELGGQMGWLASGMDFKFKKPVYPEETVTCTVTLDQVDPDGKARATAVFTNDDGEVKIKAFLYGILPGPRERAIMADLPPQNGPISRLAVRPPWGGKSRRWRFMTPAGSGSNGATFKGGENGDLLPGAQSGGKSRV